MSAPAAQAASVDTTLPAAQVTSSSALLSGTANTGNFASFATFQYGLTASYGQQTTAEAIPAGRGTVKVSFRVTGLRAATRYHFRVASASFPGGYYYPFGAAGDDRTFTTKANPTTFLRLGNRRLSVRRGFLFVPLSCQAPAGSSKSTRGCSGRFYVTTTGARHRQIRCATELFALKPRSRTTAKARVARGCLVLLARARRLTIGARFLANQTSHPSLRSSISLTLRK